MIKIDGTNLNIKKFIQVARFNEPVKLCDKAVQQVKKASDYIAEVVKKDKPVYGINTGFGKLSDTTVDRKDLSKLQENLLKSHACGVGNPLKEEIVRGMILLRVNALIKGNSGIRLQVLEKLIEFLNKGVTPVVFEKGSLGASGDLAPLSHMSLPLINLGECFYKGERFPTEELLDTLDIKPIKQLLAKEGLSLINGTQCMTSIGAFALHDAFDLLEDIHVVSSLTFEALQGITDIFYDRVHQVRGQHGQIKVAKIMRDILTDSHLTTKQGEKRVQDAYSLRCLPQVHGATLDTLEFVKDKVEIEMNAATDNPLIFTEDDKVISAGNFHGQPLALAFDYLKIAMSELANISERRLERMVNPNLSNGLPPFLVDQPGINSGFMIVQYSAASVVSENKVLAHPSSVDSIPSSANQEDHVSMGTTSARHALMIVENVRKVIAMELFTACQAIDFRGKTNLSKRTKKAYNKVREYIPFIDHDEVMYKHIHLIEDLVASKEFKEHFLKEESNA
ncbi:MAG: histidine ammonia-lyase [Candidatus Izimaplasma sp.]|nr:histidine ammonia-lyase [Candidatus Izimaplasma bacterium]